MGVFSKVFGEIKDVSMGVVYIVIISLVLLGFKATNNAACATGYTLNATANNCYLTTNTSVTTTISSLGSSIDTTLTAIASPITWISLVVIAVIGFALLKYFGKKN